MPRNKIPGLTPYKEAARQPGRFIRYWHPVYKIWIARAWPVRKAKPTAPEQKNRNDFKAVTAMIKRCCAQDVELATALSANTGYIPRDILSMAAYGTLVNCTTRDGRVWKGRRQMYPDIISYLNSIGNQAGGLLVPNGTTWDILPPGSPNASLKMDGTGTQIEWSSSSGGGNQAIDPYGPPSPTAFTFLSGDATVMTATAGTNTGTLIDSGASTGSGLLRTAEVPLPTIPYTFSTRIRATYVPAAYRTYGIGVSDGTKYSIIQLGCNNYSPFLEVTRYDTLSSFNTNIFGANPTIPYEYMQFSNDGTTRSVKVGADGIHWATLYTEPAGTYQIETNAVIFTQPFNDTGGSPNDHIYLQVPWMTLTTP